LTPPISLTFARFNRLFQGADLCGNSGCKRIGVLAEKTMGHHDLVCDFDARLKWNGKTYKYRAAK